MAKTYYDISFDMKSSHNFTVKAETKTEAKQKAFKKFERLRNKMSQYNIDVEDFGY